MNIKLIPEKTLVKLLLLISFLLIAHVSGLISIHYFDHDYVYGLIPLFNFEGEMNIPSVFSFFGLLSAGLLLSIIAVLHKKTGSPYIYWVGLALVLIFLSVDELLGIHEQLSQSLTVLLNTSSTGILADPYILPYGVALLILGFIYLKFLADLPRKVLFLFIFSGAVYVAGAMILDSLGYIHANLYGEKTFAYYLFHTSEELLEMLGIAAFIYSLLLYIKIQFNNIAFSIKNITISFKD